MPVEQGLPWHPVATGLAGQAIPFIVAASHAHALPSAPFWFPVPVVLVASPALLCPSSLSAVLALVPSGVAPAFCVSVLLLPLSDGAPVTFRRGVVSLRGPGQSPVLPFACGVGSLRSVGRCGRCSCWCCFRVRGAQSLVCWGCAGCGGMCRLRVSGAQWLAYWGLCWLLFPFPRQSNPIPVGPALPQ